MFWGAKIADSIERNAFLMKTTRFFFFLKLSSARDSASSVLIFLQIHSPPCLDFDTHGSESARSAFFWGGEFEKKKMIKRENPSKQNEPQSFFFESLVFFQFFSKINLFIDLFRERWAGLGPGHVPKPGPGPGLGLWAWP